MIDGRAHFHCLSDLLLLEETLKKLIWRSFYAEPPISPDLDYPIETLWAYLKNRVKKRITKIWKN